MAAVSDAPAYWGPSVNRSWMSLDLKKRFCFGSRSTCSQEQSSSGLRKWYSLNRLQNVYGFEAALPRLEFDVRRQRTFSVRNCL